MPRTGTIRSSRLTIYAVHVSSYLPFKAHCIRCSRLIIYAVQGSLYTPFKAHDFCRSRLIIYAVQGTILEAHDKYYRSSFWLLQGLRLTSKKPHSYVYFLRHCTSQLGSGSTSVQGQNPATYHWSYTDHMHMQIDTTDFHRIIIFPCKRLSRASFS